MRHQRENIRQTRNLSRKELEATRGGGAEELDALSRQDALGPAVGGNHRPDLVWWDSSGIPVD